MIRPGASRQSMRWSLLVLQLLTPAWAATATVSAEVVAPALVLVDASAQLGNAATGVLTLSIPGAGGAPQTSLALTVSATTASGAVFFSTQDAAGLGRLITRMATAGGVLSTGGILNGQGVQIVVVQASQSGDGGGTVTAIVTYN